MTPPSQSPPSSLLIGARPAAASRHRRYLGQGSLCFGGTFILGQVRWPGGRRCRGQVQVLGVARGCRGGPHWPGVVSVVVGAPGWWQSWRWCCVVQQSVAAPPSSTSQHRDQSSEQQPSQHSPDMADREDKVYKAKLAEQAERYDGE